MIQEPIQCKVCNFRNAERNWNQTRFLASYLVATQYCNTSMIMIIHCKHLTEFLHIFLGKSSSTDGTLCESAFFERTEADWSICDASDCLTTRLQHTTTCSRSDDVKAKMRLETGRHPSRKYDKQSRATPLVSDMLSCDGQSNDPDSPPRWHTAKSITPCMWLSWMPALSPNCANTITPHMV